MPQVVILANVGSIPTPLFTLRMDARGYTGGIHMDTCDGKQTRCMRPACLYCQAVTSVELYGSFVAAQLADEMREARERISSALAEVNHAS